MKSQGFEPTWVDPNVYHKDTPAGKFYIGVYVDDLLVCCPTPGAYEGFVKAMREAFVFEDNGPVSYFLGLNVTQIGPHTIGFNMKAYIRRMVDKLIPGDSKSCPENPCVLDFDKVLEEAEDGREGFKGREELIKEYRRVMGALLYCSGAGRPDITLPVNKLCRVLTCPTNRALAAAYHILRYLRGTSDLGIVYQGGLPIDVVAYGLTPLKVSPKDVLTYSDSDWAVGPSTTAYLVMLCGAPVAWKSSKQTCTSGSSTEAELIAANAAACESLYIKRLVVALLHDVRVTVLLRCDNQGAVAFSLHPKTVSRMKHVQRDFIRIREFVDAKELCVKYIDTKANLADALSKALQTSRFRALVVRFMSPIARP